MLCIVKLLKNMFSDLNRYYKLSTTVPIKPNPDKSLGPPFFRTFHYAHTLTFSSPPTRLNTSACLTVQFFSASAFSISVLWTENNVLNRKILHRNLAAANAWNYISFPVEAVDNADDGLMRFVFEARTNRTGVVLSLGSVSLSVEACPVYEIFYLPGMMILIDSKHTPNKASWDLGQN